MINGFRYSLLLVFMLMMYGCTPETLTSAPSTSTPQEKDRKLHFLALGDSYTIGQSVPERDRWPNQLVDLLTKKGFPTEVTVIASTGWTTADLWYGIEKENPQKTFDLVTLLIGVNDQFRGYPVDAYREDFQYMLRKAIECADGNVDRVIVLSIPDYGYTPAYAYRNPEQVSLGIDAFNSVNRDEAEHAGAYYVDVTTISRMALDDFELTTGDRMHPSGKMYSMWVEKVYPIALEIIKK